MLRKIGQAILVHTLACVYTLYKYISNNDKAGAKEHWWKEMFDFSFFYGLLKQSKEVGKRLYLL